MYVLLIYVSDWSECILALFQVSRENPIFWRLKGATTRQLVPNARTWRGPHGNLTRKKTLDWIGWPWRDHPQWLVDHPSLVKPDHQQNKDQKTRPDEEKKRPLTLKTEYLTKKRIKLTNSVTARQTAKINLIYYIQKPRFQVNFNYRSSPNRSFSF